MRRFAVLFLLLLLCAGLPGVPAAGQTIPPAPLRILFLGNSLTRSIGWRDGDKYDRPWGMAASQPSADYVHQTWARIAAATGQVPEIRTASIDLIYPEHFATARQVGQAFTPDVIVLEVGDAAQQMTEAEYLATLRTIHGWFPGVRWVVTGVWYVARLEQYNRAFAAEIGAPFVPLNDLNVPEHWQRPDCEQHGSVCDHPGDTGMEMIAERLTAAILQERTAVFVPWLEGD